MSGRCSTSVSSFNSLLSLLHSYLSLLMYATEPRWAPYGPYTASTSRSCAKLYPLSPRREIFFPLPFWHDRRIDNPLSLYHVVRMDIGRSRARVSAIKKMGSLLIENWPSFFVVLAVMRSWNRARCAVTVRKRVPQIGPFFRSMSDVVGWATFFSPLFGIRGNYGFANDRSFSLSLSIYSVVPISR